MSEAPRGEGRKMLTDIQDAFGHAMWDAYRSKGIQNSYEVLERDDGLVGVDPLNAYFAEPEDWNPVLRRALRFARGQVLDVGSGAGRHSLYLQGKALEVTALDNSPLALEVCRLRGVKRTLLTPIQDLGRQSGQYDTILMLGGNLGLFGSARGTASLLSKFTALTPKKGRIIAETRDPYVTTEPEHLGYHESNRNRGRMSGQIRMRVRYKKYIGPWFDYLLVSKAELEALLSPTVWVVSRYLDYTPNTYVAIIDKKKGGKG